MPRYRNVKKGRARYVEASIALKDVGGRERYSIKINNLDRQDFEDAAEPTEWKRYEINQQWMLIVTKATRSTGFTEAGEIVALLKSRDNRRIRIKLNDFTIRDFRRLSKTLSFVYDTTNRRRKRAYKASF